MTAWALKFDRTMVKHNSIPKLDWYTSESERLGVTPRCPFASVERCPRYYQSLSLLGTAGSTSIDSSEDSRLREFWEGSDLWPRTREYATAIFGSKNDDGDWERMSLSNFCPEVAYDRFGYFASGLGDYADEIDAGIAHENLAKNDGAPGHWRWRWNSLEQMHYTSCPTYAPLTRDGGFLSSGGPEFTIGVPGASVRFKFSWRDLRDWIAHYGSRMLNHFATFLRK